MKRFFICAAAAIVALAACSKTEVINNSVPQEIGFKAVTGAMTKAFVEWDEANTVMGVYAYNGTEEYLANVQFKQQGTDFAGWDGAKHKPYYWPIGASLDFVLYAPYMSSGAEYTYADNELTLAVDNSGTNQTDVLYGSEKISKTKQTTAIPVTLKHALAMVKVVINADQDDVVTVTSLTINGTYQKETATVDYTTANAPALSWTKAGSTKDMQLFTSLVLKADSATPAQTSYCYVVPSNQTSIKIDYTLGGVDHTYTHELTTLGTWDAGKRYTYNITIGASEIKFNPTVEDWADHTPAYDNIEVIPGA